MEAGDDKIYRHTMYGNCKISETITSFGKKYCRIILLRSYPKLNETALVPASSLRKVFAE